MDVDCKDYRRSKPQQKIYKPGSGPLRRSSYDTRMDAYDVENSSRGRNENHYGSHMSVNNEDGNAAFKEQSVTYIRHKKPEQQLYVPRSGESNSEVDKSSKNASQSNHRRYNKHDRHGYNSNTGTYSKGGSRRDRSYGEFHTNNDINYNRNFRQVSEPRCISPKYCKPDQNSVDRNRDTRSMETSAGRHGASSGGGKPPSGRRNSSGYPSEPSRPKYMLNIDNMPPRFRKKLLEQSGHHSFDSVDQLNREKNSYNQSIPNISHNYNQGQQHNNLNPSWSQTLPSRGRGRLRHNEEIDRDKFVNTYLKNCEIQNSRRSTPSNSYMNLYEASSSENKTGHYDKTDTMANSIESHKDLYDNVSKNGMNTDETCNHTDDQINNESDSQNDKESVSQSLMDMTNLDWTEEVEKNIKLDDMCDSSTSFSQNLKTSSTSQDIKPAETRESKRSGRSRRRDKRSSSRGQRNSEKKTERNRKDSNASVQHEPMISNLKQRERERRDSYKSNRSSTIGNSRDDLDRWRSLRSYSREQSAEGRIVSQCNSRDPSTNRALSPRDHDGFRVPSAMSKSTSWTSNNQKKNGSWTSGRGASVERGRQSPAPSNVSGGGEAMGEGGGGRRGRNKRQGRRRRNADPAPPAPAPPPATLHASTNWREEILESKRQNATDRPSENSHRRNRLNSTLSDKSLSETSTSQPGLLVLPQGSMPHVKRDQGRGGSMETQKTLYDHQNPSKPIIVQTNPSKMDMRLERGGGVGAVGACADAGARGYEAGDAARAARHRQLLQEVERADAILQTLMLRGPLALADHWPDAADTRKFLQGALEKLLKLDLKYCQADNMEHHFWKILYYNFIEVLRKSLSQASPEDKSKIVKLINTIIEEGNVYFEGLVHMLEQSYKFNTDDYLNDNHLLPPKGLGYLGLALISVQKLYVFLGDLARYKEQVNETNNYAKSKFWYTKAQQINPKNGRPYNQLAILAIYARRKLDAVYYYMRSLMSSNPFHSAREGLLSLFEENRKKYEAAERKRRAAFESARETENAEVNGASAASASGANIAQRREVWVRPSGHRTTLRDDAALAEEHIAAMTPVELNKNFITSYLHVHGKLITKIGMETFHSSANQMLRQFRALLHRQPLPTPAARLLQLTALNMYAVETSADSLKDSNGGERSAWLECALGVSLLMFGALLERCCALLPEPPNSQQHTDALLLLPAIKVWSDWMLCHSSTWNPPPAFDNFEIGNESDPWDWLARLMNILEDLDDKSIEFENEMKEGYTAVRLAEDSSLAGFTPLMYMVPAGAWLRPEPAPVPPHAAEHVLRTRRLLFFGTEYLVGVDPPVLGLEYHVDAPPRYVSAVKRFRAHHAALHHLSEDSEDEESADVASEPTSLSEANEASEADEATRKLLRRKEKLEIRNATMERRRQRVQEMLHSVSVEIEVRPRWLVPDTNCFIDHLPLLQAVVTAPSQPYQLAVPLVVMKELEGLQRCSRVGESARAALAWVGSASASAVRLTTTRGTLLASRTFTAERDEPESASPSAPANASAPSTALRRTNDDRVLHTALNLHRNQPSDTESRGEEGAEAGERSVRRVVLLSEDRNLRVKALAADLPARDVPSFVTWAGLTPQNNQNSQQKVNDEKNSGHN